MDPQVFQQEVLAEGVLSYAERVADIPWSSCSYEAVGRYQSCLDWASGVQKAKLVQLLETAAGPDGS